MLLDFRGCNFENWKAANVKIKITYVEKNFLAKTAFDTFKTSYKIIVIVD